MHVVARSVHEAMRSVLDVLYPVMCLVCGRRIPTGRWMVCESCWDGLPRLWNTHQIDERLSADITMAVFEYREPFQCVLHAYKYGGIRSLAYPLALELRDVLRQCSDPPDILVPVPLHPARLRERGYNQSRLLATELGHACGVPVLPPGHFRRIRYTSSQARLDRQHRLQNLSHAFRVIQSRDLRDRRVALVDDVLTTGSTLEECAQTLYRSGVRSVCTLTVARD
jgi:ComF family protein